MEFGVLSVGDPTPDTTTGITQAENERIKAHVAIARQGAGVAAEAIS